MRKSWTECGAVLAVIVASISWPAGSAFAGEFTPVAQSREIRAEDHHVTTGYTCLGGGGGPPLPACPVTLGDVTTSDVQTAPGFLPDPFVATASVIGASAQHTSSIQPKVITASGSGTATGTADDPSPPSGYVFVLDVHDRSVLDTTGITVDLDQPTPFTFEAGGRVEYPDPSFPASWSVDLAISLEGPGGPVVSFGVAPFGCPDGDPLTYVCWVEPDPLVVTGTLPAGQYTLQVVMSSSANGNYLPSVGVFGGTTAAEYDVALTLGSAAPVPMLGPLGISILAVLLVAAAVALNSRAGRSE